MTRREYKERDQKWKITLNTDTSIEPAENSRSSNCQPHKALERQLCRQTEESSLELKSNDEGFDKTKKDLSVVDIFLRKQNADEYLPQAFFKNQALAHSDDMLNRNMIPCESDINDHRRSDDDMVDENRVVQRFLASKDFSNNLVDGQSEVDGENKLTVLRKENDSQINLAHSDTDRNFPLQLRPCPESLVQVSRSFSKDSSSGHSVSFSDNLSGNIVHTSSDIKERMPFTNASQINTSVESEANEPEMKKQVADDYQEMNLHTLPQAEHMTTTALLELPKESCRVASDILNNAEYYHSQTGFQSASKDIGDFQDMERRQPSNSNTNPASNHIIPDSNSKLNSVDSVNNVSKASSHHTRHTPAELEMLMRQQLLFLDLLDDTVNIYLYKRILAPIFHCFCNLLKYFYRSANVCRNYKVTL